jgi:hypothetical protein
MNGANQQNNQSNVTILHRRLSNIEIFGTKLKDLLKLNEQQFLDTINTGFDRALKREVEKQISKYKPAKIPQKIAKYVAKEAEDGGEMCPITFDDIKVATASVTSCYHVFERDAIAQWMITNDWCPVCKQKCAISIIE